MAMTRVPAVQVQFDDHHNDDDSAEGAAFRDLFFNESDSSSCSSNDDEENNVSAERQQVSQSSASVVLVQQQEEEDVCVHRSILHVIVKEKQVGGSITQRLWPSAEYLATFVLDCYNGRITCETLQQQQQQQCTTNHYHQGQKAQNLLLSLSLLEKLTTILQQSASTPLHILELGAGIGLVGLELATQLNARVLLTELEEGLPLLQQNRLLNMERFYLGGQEDAVQVDRLYWGNAQDVKKALEWYNSSKATTTAAVTTGESYSFSDQQQQPLLILASDCVYWEEFHKPLEEALAGLLSAVPSNSLCLLAGPRRWKRDNTFYQNLGKASKTKTHSLQCTCLQETVRRNTTTTTCTDGQEESSSREVMRIYAIQWVPLLREIKKL
jgi:hypothetical protein